MAIADHVNNKDLKTSYHAEMFRVLMVGFCQDYVTPFLRGPGAPFTWDC